jgi:hypothetical protein
MAHPFITYADDRTAIPHPQAEKRANRTGNGFLGDDSAIFVVPVAYHVPLRWQVLLADDEGLRGTMNQPPCGYLLTTSAGKKSE